MTDEQIKYMVDRFLGWRLPENFNPDAGISFNPEYSVEYNAAQEKPPARHQPVGTNLFDAQQADAMVRYMIYGMLGAPSETTVREFLGWLSGDVLELHNVEVPKLADSWERFKAATILQSSR